MECTKSKSLIQPRHHWTLLLKIWPAGLIILLWLLFFWPIITGQTVPGFRDSAYLYYPLFWWIDQQIAAGELPLWNPYCGFGYPTVADGTSSVFYPGKLIFFLRFLEFPTRYGNFLASHVLIAAGGAYWLARTMKANQACATLAAIGYAFGGTLLFQVNNCPYLISGAWLPFAMVCVWKLAHRGCKKYVVGGAIFCALMILAGDPQMVYHVGLIALAIIIVGFQRKRKRFLRSKRHQLQRPYPWLAGRLIRLTFMSLLTALLAAIQLLPTWVWAQESERRFYYGPRSVYELSEYAGWENEEKGRSIFASLVGDPTDRMEEDCHHLHLYQFSQPPWTVAEWFWPNFSGSMFPENLRWSSKLPSADRVWNASLYSGCLVVILALLSLRLWGRFRRQVLLTWILMFFLLASFGWFGAVWLVRELFGSEALGSIETAIGMRLGNQAGGPYWLLVTVLPKYVLFRYPAKLIMIASLVVCVLAGIGLTRVMRSRSNFGYVIECMIGISLLLACFVTKPLEWVKLDPWENVFAAEAVVYGPFLEQQSQQQLLFSFLLVAFVLLLFRLSSLPKRSKQTRLFIAGCACLLTSADVFLANEWMLAKVPSSVFAAANDVSWKLDQRYQALPEGAPEVVAELPIAELGQNQVDWQTSSDERCAEIVAAQIKSHFPKFHLMQSKRNINSFTSLNSVFYQDQIEQAEWRPEFKPYMFMIWDHSIRPLALPLRSKNRAKTWESGLRRIGFNARVVDDQVKLIQFGNNRMTFELDIKRESTLLIREQFGPGWRASVLQEDRTHLPVNVERVGAFRSISLPPGNLRIQMIYRPTEFYVGAGISCLSWLALGYWASVWCWRRFKRTKKS